MLKFFRRIRRKLLDEGSLKKYLVYAIGEILLVVIGILIALQINNWNNDRIAGDQMTSYLISLKNDLQKDTANFSTSIRGYKRYIDTKKYLKLSHFENVPTDSLVPLVVSLTVINMPVVTTFEKLINSGITQISDNDSLSQNVYDYYTTKLDKFNNMISYERRQSANDSEYFVQGQNLYEFDFPELPNFQNEKENRNNLLKLISEPRGRNHLKIGYVRKIRILNTYQDIKKDALNLIIEIDKEIEKR